MPESLRNATDCSGETGVDLRAEISRSVSAGANRRSTIQYRMNCGEKARLVEEAPSCRSYLFAGDAGIEPDAANKPSVRL